MGSHKCGDCSADYINEGWKGCKGCVCVCVCVCVLMSVNRCMEPVRVGNNSHDFYFQHDYINFRLLLFRILKNIEHYTGNNTIHGHCTPILHPYRRRVTFLCDELGWLLLFTYTHAQTVTQNGALRHERVCDKQRRLRQQTQMYAQGWIHIMWWLRSWVCQTRSEGLQRFVCQWMDCSSREGFVCVQSQQHYLNFLRRAMTF